MKINYKITLQNMMQKFINDKDIENSSIQHVIFACKGWTILPCNAKDLLRTSHTAKLKLLAEEV